MTLMMSIYVAMQDKNAYIICSNNLMNVEIIQYSIAGEYISILFFKLAYH